MKSYLVERLAEIAYAMNRAGTQVNREGFLTEVGKLDDKTREPFLDVLHDDILYGQWSESEADLFWRCKGPHLMYLPYSAQVTLKGYRVSTYQPLLYEAARTAGMKEWLSHYEAGGDLLKLASTKLHMTPQKAKIAVYRYLYGGLDSPTTWQVEATFPWMAKLIDRFEQSSLDDEDITTRFGTTLCHSLFPRATLGRYLTQTSKDVIRTGVFLMWTLNGVHPSFITPECVVLPDHHQDVSRLWQGHGFRVQIEHL